MPKLGIKMGLAKKMTGFWGSLVAVSAIMSLIFAACGSGGTDPAELAPPTGPTIPRPEVISPPRADNGAGSGQSDPDGTNTGGTISRRTTYVIQDGDTLETIAARYPGVSVDDIVRLNTSLSDPDKISIGQEITIPAPDPAAATSTTSSSDDASDLDDGGTSSTTLPSDGSIYIVQSGDNLSSIAEQYPGVSVGNIVAANDLEDPNQIREGQRLNIPIP